MKWGIKVALHHQPSGWRSLQATGAEVLMDNSLEKWEQQFREL